MKLRHYIVALVLVPLLLLLRFVADIGDKTPGIHTVIRVIDGDTVELEGGERLRLIGIDTPEHGEPFFDSAKIFLSNMVLNQKVRVGLGYRKRGSYGRLLGYIYLDTIFVNAAILKRGLGRMYLFPDNRYEQQIMDDFFAAQRQALSEQLGIWTLPVAMEEDHYIGHMTRLRFHRPHCESVSKMAENHKIIFTRREDAFYEGYAPCRNCRP